MNSTIAAGTLVSSAVKQATFQKNTPVQTGATGVPGVSDEDEQLTAAIAASMEGPNAAALPGVAGPSHAAGGAAGAAGAASAAAQPAVAAAAMSDDDFEKQMQAAMAQSLQAQEAAAPGSDTAASDEDDDAAPLDIDDDEDEELQVGPSGATSICSSCLLCKAIALAVPPSKPQPRSAHRSQSGAGLLLLESVNHEVQAQTSACVVQHVHAILHQASCRTQMSSNEHPVISNELAGAELQAVAQQRLDQLPQENATCRIAIQLPNTRVVHKFSPEAAVQAVYDLAVVSLPLDKAANAFQLVVSAPGGQPLTDKGATLQDAGLGGSLLRLSWE